MKYSPQTYGRAFVETVVSLPQAKQKEVILRFLQIIRKNGDYSQIKKIFKAVSELVVKKRGGKVVILEFARDINPALAEQIKKNFSPKDFLTVSFRPELVAGVRILINGERELDMSMRWKLRKLFNI